MICRSSTIRRGAAGAASPIIMPGAAAFSPSRSSSAPREFLRPYMPVRFLNFVPSPVLELRLIFNSNSYFSESEPFSPSISPTNRSKAAERTIKRSPSLSPELNMGEHQLINGEAFPHETFQTPRARRNPKRRRPASM